MKTNSPQFRELKRKMEFESLRDLIHQNRIVNEYVELYVKGVLVTREETWNQMVRALTSRIYNLEKKQIECNTHRWLSGWSQEEKCKE